MDRRIIKTANKYKELALMLESFELDKQIDEGAPEEAQTALIKLYYSKVFDAEIEKCEDLLEEDTDEETVNAVEEAADAIETVYESAFSVVEECYFHDRELAQRIDDITANTETGDLFLKLIKLYKCEGIIRNAYRYPKKDAYAHTRLQGLYGTQEEQDDVPMNAEEKIKQKLGIDIYELIEIRQRLIDEIGSIIKGINML